MGLGVFSRLTSDNSLLIPRSSFLPSKHGSDLWSSFERSSTLHGALFTVPVGFLWFNGNISSIRRAKMPTGCASIKSFFYQNSSGENFPQLLYGPFINAFNIIQRKDNRIIGDSCCRYFQTVFSHPIHIIFRKTLLGKCNIEV